MTIRTPGLLFGVPCVECDKHPTQDGFLRTSPQGLPARIPQSVALRADGALFCTQCGHKSFTCGEHEEIAVDSRVAQILQLLIEQCMYRVEQVNECIGTFMLFNRTDTYSDCRISVAAQLPAADVTGVTKYDARLLENRPPAFIEHALRLLGSCVNLNVQVSPSGNAIARMWFTAAHGGLTKVYFGWTEEARKV